VLHDDVLVKVYATGVNPIDWKIREGQRKGAERSFPSIPGWDVSGVIEQIGRDATGFSIGDEVYGRPDSARNGTYAEYAAVRATELSHKPKTIDHIAAATISLTGLTAWQGIFDHGQLQPGQRILIHGAAGGVGIFAVQLARWKNAHVIGTASANNIDFLKGLGADEVIDYTSVPFEKVVRNVDVVFDTIGGDTQTKSMEVLKPGGILVSTVGIRDKAAVEAKGLKGVQYMAQAYPDQLKQLATLVDAGVIKTVIAAVLPLTEAQKAQDMSKQGHTRGKIALKVV
jgi:NADPH:quinone reductase-like Zn-dependent oxidoreductase